MVSAFIEQKHLDEFMLKGFVQFPLLNAGEVEFALSVFNTIDSNEGRMQKTNYFGINYSLGTVSFDENQKLMAPLLKLLEEKLASRFNNFELTGCGFINKRPHTNASFQYHQDWSYTNEQEFAFVTCWIPLCDTNTNKGCMSLIEGSHRYFESYRSDSLPSARVNFEDVPVELRTDVPQSSGSCLAFHQAAFHGSYPNLTDQNRPVLAVIVKPKQVPVTHYVKNGQGYTAYQMSTAGFEQMLAKIPKSEIPPEAIVLHTSHSTPITPSAADLVSHWRANNPEHCLFKQQELNYTFTRNGYVILRNVIEPSAIEQLKKLYNENFINEGGMYVTHHAVTDRDKNKRMGNSIFELLNPFINNTFINFAHLLSHFAAKTKGNSGLFNLHQDWSIIEEEKYGVLHCWVPLQDSNVDNGTLAFLPKSHLLFHNYRSGSCPIRFTHLSNYPNRIVHADVKAGDVVIYHPSLFHGSGPNQTDKERLAVVSAITHTNAKRVYFHKTNDKVNMYELTDTDLFSRLDDLAKGGMPTGDLLEPATYGGLEISDEEIVQQLTAFCPINTSNTYAEV